MTGSPGAAVSGAGWTSTLRIRRRLCDTANEGLAELYDADTTSLTRSNFLVTAVDGIVELIETLGVVAILAPLARSRQEGVLAFERSNDDPHSASDPCRFLVQEYR